MERLNFYSTDPQADMLRSIADRTGLTVAEVLRRMIDYCSQQDVLKSLIPHISGHMAARVMK